MSIIIPTGLTFRKTRIAPTPSGYLHLGNVLSFAITAALAKRTNAKIFLRIDDLDRPRIQREFVQDIFDTLNFMEIPWDEGPKNYHEYETQYSQVHRMEIYKDALLQLKDSGDVFACTCSRTQVQIQDNEHTYHGICMHGDIPFEAEQVSWRVDTTHAALLTVHTLQGLLSATLPLDIHHFVVRKKDGYPAYQLTSLLDDVHFGIDLIVRGQDLWPSTLAQLHLASILEKDAFLQTTFHHHPLINAATGEKLSKSAGSTSLQYLRSQGKTRSAIYGMIAAMSGFNNKLESFEELAALFLQ